MGTLRPPRLGLLVLLIAAFSIHGATSRSLSQKENGSPPPGGFLEDEVPLTVVSTMPEKLLTGGKIAVTGRESLTVVLSRPVLPIGQEVDDKTFEEKKPFSLSPEVAGQYRWLTTYIVVFEPAEDWASDLEVDFELNADLVTFDGVPLTVSGTAASRLTTPALNLTAVAVTSNATNYLTDNFWDAFVGTSFDFLPEMPVDAFIQIVATSPINLDVLQTSLLVVDPLTNGNPPVSVSVAECSIAEIPCADCLPEDVSVEETGGGNSEPELPVYGSFYEEAEEEEEEEVIEEPKKKETRLTGASSSCINVSFNHEQEQGFAQGRRYSLVLPSDTQYSNDAGPLTKDITLDFAGLRDFRVPFVEDSNFNVSSSRLFMWIPHGLPEGQNLTDFPMKLVRAKTGQDVDFSLELVSKSVIRVNANFNPGSTYRINVFESPSFKDGYGLTLKRSNINFLAAPIEPFFGAMSVPTDVKLAIFEAGQDWGKKIVVVSKGSPLSDDSVCKREGSAIFAWDISDPESGLPLLSKEPLDTSVTDLLGVAAARLVDERTDIAGDTQEMGITKLLKTSGLVAGSYCRNDKHHPLVVSETELQVVVLITSAVTSKGRTALVWVTNMKTSSPVVDATVALYEPTGKNKFKAVSDGETDKDGAALLSIDGGIRELHAVVTHDGNSIYVPQVEVQNGVVSAISDSVVLDRPIVRPGEWLRVKGYVMQRDGGDYLPSDVKNVRVVVSPSMVSRTKESDVIDITRFNEDFGSYTLSVRIPLSVIAVHHTVRVEADLPGGGTYVGKPEPFTVLNSRRAPAVLTINAPAWALPNKKLKVKSGVTSFAGAPIEDARLLFVWRIQDDARDEDDEALAGRVVAQTDGSGEASATIDLTKFANAPSAGTILQITAHYTGSSGERVESSTSVRLEPADVDIVLEKTVDTDLPQQEFGIRAAVYDLAGKRLTTRGTVSYALKQIAEFRANGRPTLKPTTSNSEAPGKAIEKCEQSYKSTDFCRFKLPKMGEYVVEACVKVGKSKACKRSYMGKTKNAWETAPLEQHLPFGVAPITSGPYAVGDEASFLVENPFDDVTVLMAWGSRDEVKKKLVKLKTGATTLKFDVDNTCTDNCALSISAAIPRQKKGLASDVSVPVSAVFDPAMPHNEHYTTVIETKREKATLAMKVSVPGIKMDNGVPLMEPGLNASVRVTFDRKGPVEITAFAIDTKILDLLPYPLKDVSDDFVSDLSDYFRYKSTSENMVAPGAIDAITKANEARKKLDPWFRMISTLQPSEETADIQLTDDQYLEQYVQYLTVVPRTPEEKAAAAAASSESINDTEEDEPTETPAPHSRIALMSRPTYATPTLFESYTASGGVWLVNFEGPKEGGEFMIRAYASSGTGLFGSDEVRVRVKRNIAVTHDFPTFSRLGDEFEAAIKIGTLKVAEKPIALTIEPSENLKMEGSEKRDIHMGKGLEKEILVKFTAKGVGESTIKIVADDGTGNDAKTTIGLTIYGPQPPVVLGSAFPVSGDSDEEPSTEMIVPNALEGSGSLVVAAGEGHLAGLLLLADQIYSQDSFTCPVSADFVVANLAIPAIVDFYYPWSPDPNLLPEFYVNLINGMLETYQLALTTIYEESTSVSLGLQPEVPCQSGGVSKPGVSLEQNAKGIIIIDNVEKRLKEHNLEEIYKNTAAVFTARRTWLSVLEDGIVEEAAAAREKKDVISTSIVAMARYVLGTEWAPPKGTSSDIVADLSMARLKKEFDSMSVESQAYYALALLSVKKVDRAEVRKVFGSWENKMTTAGNRAYVASGKDSVTADSSLANSLVFLAMVRGGASDNLLKRMAYYVTAPISDPYGFNDYSIYAKMVAMIGLAEYDESLKPQKNNLRLELRSGTIILFSASFTSGRHPVSAQSTAWEDLGNNPGPIQVFPQGDGEINVAIAMKYVPSDALDNPIYKGIYVERVIQLDNAGPLSEGVSKVPMGTVVNVKIHFMTPTDLEHTTVQVSLPAGLEPVQLGGEGAEFCPIPFFDLFSDKFYPSCPEQTTLADQVQFVYKSVSKGAHTVTFKAVAAISGSFGMPPARVFVTDTPSVMGMSSAARLDICKASEKKCTIETADTEFIATECKNNCNGNGVCDLSNGKCSCFYGFGGDDCQKAGAA